uniref:Kringle domain-containing protein n=1 Tax=Eptatretus burgeri TaxID=7764 RepID=A0A8C4QDN9_EPTBU
MTCSKKLNLFLLVISCFFSLQGCVEDCFHCRGMDYRGEINKTMSGITCLHWDSLSPKQYRRTPDRYPDGDLRENFCRNPDNDRKPWCYKSTNTSDGDPNWEYCDIPRCYVKFPKIQNITTKCFNVRSTAYRGKVSKTRSGLTCQRWDDQKPHEHNRNKKDYPCSEWSVQRSTPTLQIDIFHKRRGEILKPIHYLLFYTELNHDTTNNYSIFFSDRLSPITTSLITHIENEANEYHEEWQNMNEILIYLQSFRRELKNIISRLLEDLSHPLTLDKSKER